MDGFGHWIANWGVLGMPNISVVSVVYNEESRIDRFVDNFNWSDDLVIVDKSSTDRTREILLDRKVTVITRPYSHTGDEVKFAIEKARHEWVLFVTASDVVHPNLPRKLEALIAHPDFPYDGIEIPFAIYVLGIRDVKHSPWDKKSKLLLAKKGSIHTSNIVHNEVLFSPKQVLSLGYSENENLCHLTHPSVDFLLERHMRYAKLEAKEVSNRRLGMRRAKKGLLRAIFRVLFEKRSFILGDKGIALALAYMSYSALTYLYIWEKFDGAGSIKYDVIKNDFDMLRSKLT